MAGADGSGTDASEAARTELDVARHDVMESEAEIQAIKRVLRNLNNADGIATGSSLRISAHKVSGLPESAKPTFKIQLSSPIEELSLTKLYDPLVPLDDAESANDGSVVKFEDVEVSVATLTVSAYDAEIYLGSSASHDVSTLCDFDALTYCKTVVMGTEEDAKVAKVTKLDLAIVADDQSGTDQIGPASTEEVEDEKIASILLGGADSAAGEKEGSEEIPKEGGEETKTADQDAPELQTAADGGAAVAEKEESAVAVKYSTERAQDAPVDKGSGAGEDNKEKESDVSQQGQKDTTDDDNSAGIEPKASMQQTEGGDTAEKSPKSPSSTVVEALATVSLQVEYTPSKKDQQEKLYELLNKASKRKALALERLRKSAAAVSRTKEKETSAEESMTRSSGGTDRAVKSGFLNKKAKKKEPGFLAKWYDRIAGPSSFVVRVFPVAKNYCLFFGVVALMHFKGDSLALPAPI